MTKQERREKQADIINRLCTEAGCGDEMRKRHFDQLVDRGWNPHPPKAFVAWWAQHPNGKDFTAVKAYNTQTYLDEYVEQLPF